MKFQIIRHLLCIQCIWSMAFTAVAADSKPHEVSLIELKKVLKQYEDLERLNSTFKQTKTLKDIDVKLQSEGELTLIRPDTIIWEVKKPSPMKVELSSKEIRIQSASGTQNLKTEGTAQAESLKGLAAWLELNADALIEHYEVFQLGPKSYMFKPRKPGKSPFQQMQLQLTNAGHVDELLMTEVSGDEMRIDFEKTIIKKKKK